MSNNLVSALCWIKKGYAASNPKEFDLQEEDIEMIKGDPSIQESIKQAQDIQKQSDKEKKKNIKQQKMEDEWEEQDYEDGDELDEENYAPVFTSEFGMLKNGMPQFNDGYDFQIDEMSNEDKEDYQIQPTDSLMVAAKIEKEFSSLEVYVYEQDKSSLFVHHEIQLSAFPLALEWLPLNPLTFENGSAKQGNFVIVGTFLPEIEFWNLDVLNAIEPSIIMGGEIDQQQMQQQQMKKGKKVKQFNQSQQLFKEGSHTDSVLALNLNGFRQNILASGSADNTVKIWDISQQKNMHTFKTHSGKVQVVSWNKAQEAVLLSGGYDKNIVIQDVRQPQNAIIHQLQSEIESGGWCPYEENILYTSTEDGYVSIMDARKLGGNTKGKQNQDQYIAHFKAHNKQTTSVSFNKNVKGMISTTSMDKTVKVYDLQQIEDKVPKLVTMKNPNAGGLFCGSFYEDSAWTFACGNSNGEVFVWDTAEDKKIVQTFADRVPQEIRPDINECTQGFKVQTREKPPSDDEDDQDQEDDYDRDDFIQKNNNNDNKDKNNKKKNFKKNFKPRKNNDIDME